MWAAPLRGVLGALEAVYACGVSIRNARYDRDGFCRTLPVPVLSVGNLTVGGTGKTPLVIDLVRRVRRLGLRPVVVSRGYAAACGEPNDEERLIRRQAAGVPCIADADRVAAARVAHRMFDADVVILDDGFQHRRLGRVLDVVVVDATCPFGHDHLLPRGLLREPVASLRRAHAVVLTRCEQVSQAECSTIARRLRELAGSAVHVKCRTRVIGVERLDGTVFQEPLRGKRAFLFAGIGRPGAFAATVRGMGVNVIGHRWFTDHHRYRRREMKRLLCASRLPACDVVLTTEKDAVKLAPLVDRTATPILAVRVGIDFIEDGDKMLQSLLGRTLGRPEKVAGSADLGTDTE